MPRSSQCAALLLLLAVIAAPLVQAHAAAIPAMPAVENGVAVPVQSKRAPKAKAKAKAGKKGKQKADENQTARIWRFSRDASGPVLSFGNRKGDDIVVAFSCQPGAEQIRVVAYTASRNTRRGDSARLRLINGKTRIEIAATAFADARQNRIDIGGITKSGSQFTDLFASGETMIVEVPGRTVGVSLKTLGTAAKQFAAACDAKR